jgi:hypothetical protein
MDAALSDHLPASRDRSNRGWTWGVRVVNITILLTMCACVAPLSKSAPAATHHVHRAPALASSRTTDHELSDAEKDTLFRGFLRWRAAQSRVGLRDAPQSQPSGDVGDAAKPNERTAPGAGANIIP